MHYLHMNVTVHCYVTQRTCVHHFLQLSFSKVHNTTIVTTCTTGLIKYQNNLFYMLPLVVKGIMDSWWVFFRFTVGGALLNNVCFLGNNDFTSISKWLLRQVSRWTLSDDTPDTNWCLFLQFSLPTGDADVKCFTPRVRGMLVGGSLLIFIAVTSLKSAVVEMCMLVMPSSLFSLVMEPALDVGLEDLSRLLIRSALIWGLTNATLLFSLSLESL